MRALGSALFWLVVFILRWSTAINVRRQAQRMLRSSRREGDSYSKATGVFQSTCRGTQVLDRHTNGLEQSDFFVVAPTRRPTEHDFAQLGAEVRFLNQSLPQGL